MSLCDRGLELTLLRAQRDGPLLRGSTYGFVHSGLDWRCILGAENALRSRCPRSPRVRVACALPGLNARARRQSTAQRLKKISEEIREELKQSSKRAVKVSVPYEVWKPLGLSPKLKLVRVFVNEESLSSISHLRAQVHTQLLRLFPTLGDANPKFVLLHDEESFELRSGTTVLHTDNDVADAVAASESTGVPLTLLVVPHDIPQLDVPERVPEPQCLIDLKETGDEYVTAVSFYRFVDITDTEFVVSRLKRVLPALGVLGRIYVAKEGINAQLCVPSNMRECLDVAFMAEPTATDPLLQEVAAWAKRWVPWEVRGAFLNEDRRLPVKDTPFVDLRIKIRDKVLADGLQEPLNWSEHSGTPVSPGEWHKELTSNEEDVIVLDCRNKYESEVGMFKNARALNTNAFRDSWSWLEDKLKDVDRSKKVLTYCTGGIRCVKVGAYLEQEMGFNNVGRLEGGIVAYSKYVRESEGLESTFKGVNYVFDLRIGERITDDVLTKCLTCGKPCDVQTDCANERCDRPFESRHFVQCSDCAAKYLGCCSNKCRETVAKASQKPVLQGSLSAPDPAPGDSLSEAYAEEYSSPESRLLADLRQETISRFPARAHMVCGTLVGRYLQMLVKTSRSKRVLELGTFTGYSSLWMAMGLGSDGTLTTCDIDEESNEVARAYFDRSGLRPQIRSVLQPAGEFLDDLVASGEAEFDMVFMDANKAKYREYYDKVIGSGLLRVGGIMVADNVLFKGGVALLHDDTDETSTLSELLRRRRTHSLHEAKRLAQKIHDFNLYVRSDPRTEQLLLPLRDGLTTALRVS